MYNIKVTFRILNCTKNINARVKVLLNRSQGLVRTTGFWGIFQLLKQFHCELLACFCDSFEQFFKCQPTASRSYYHIFAGKSIDLGTLHRCDAEMASKKYYFTKRRNCRQKKLLS